MLAVEQLTKTFPSASGTVRAVSELSFAVAAGEVFGLLGPNGAGKTTTLRMIATLTTPDSGTIRVAGYDRLASPLAVRSQLAYVPAEAGLPDRLTPREVVSLFARVQGVSHPVQTADGWLDRLGASTYANTLCGALSTGMKRRVVLARALVHEPKVLILDEPTDGLDVPGRREVLALIREQALQGRAVVLSSHIMGEVEQVVHRVLLMRRGRKVTEGTVADILSASGTTTLDDAFVHVLDSTAP